MKRASKSQVALEMLINYGWALAVAAIIIGILALTSITNIASSEYCTGFSKLLCNAISLDDSGNIVMVVQNSSGDAIEINPFEDISFDGIPGLAIIVFQGKQYQFDDVVIPAGHTFAVRTLASIEADRVTVEYKAQNLGLEYSDAARIHLERPERANIEFIAECGSADESDTTYILTQNTSNCIISEVRNVTLDCKGKKTGNINVSMAGNIEIKNCVARNISVGQANNIEIKDCVVETGNIWVFNAASIKIKNCVIAGGSIQIQWTDKVEIIGCNVISPEEVRGILTSNTPKPIVANNTVTAPKGEGIYLHNTKVGYGVVTNNTINAKVGVHVYANAHQTSVGVIGNKITAKSPAPAFTDSVLFHFSGVIIRNLSDNDFCESESNEIWCSGSGTLADSRQSNNKIDGELVYKDQFGSGSSDCDLPIMTVPCS